MILLTGCGKKNSGPFWPTVDATGSYQVYSATAYDQAVTEEKKIVLFFWASRCPLCVKLDKNLHKNLARIPGDMKIFMIDYTTEEALNKTYKVTSQHTLIYIWADEKELARYVKKELTLQDIQAVWAELWGELHAEDMQAREDIVEDIVEEIWEVVMTPDFLLAENPIEITTGVVEYSPGTMWYLAYPTANPTAPGIIVIHERWGLNDQIKAMTEVFATHGYTALAVDLYDGTATEDFALAKEMSSKMSQKKIYSESSRRRNVAERTTTI